MSTTPTNWDGGPAFPRSGFSPLLCGKCLGYTGEESLTRTTPNDGMSLRANFAAQMMLALVSRMPYGTPGTRHVINWRGVPTSIESVYASVAVQLADALLAELHLPPGIAADRIAASDASGPSDGEVQ